MIVMMIIHPKDKIGLFAVILNLTDAVEVSSPGVNKNKTLERKWKKNDTNRGHYREGTFGSICSYEYL